MGGSEATAGRAGKAARLADQNRRDGTRSVEANDLRKSGVLISGNIISERRILPDCVAKKTGSNGFAFRRNSLSETRVKLQLCVCISPQPLSAHNAMRTFA